MTLPPDFTFARDLRDAGDSRQAHARAAARGSERRVARGVYLPEEHWVTADATERYRWKVLAVVRTRAHREVLSHWSAAVVHGLPIIGAWPHDVHITVGRRGGGRSSGQLVRHVVPLGEADVTEVDGLLVTSVARTVLDLAVAAQFASAVATADAALRVDRFARQPALTSIGQIQAVFLSRMPFRGHVRSREAVEFADHRVDSPLESLSRVNMRAIGCPKPVLQQRFDDHRGLIGFCEFSWPEFGLVGECDGRSKYTNPRFRRGRNLEQVLLDEKEREDRLRAIGQKVSRWGWPTAANPDLLRRHLVAAGLPMRQTA